LPGNWNANSRKAGTPPALMAFDLAASSEPEYNILESVW
jgi:hypothetical protein